MALSIIYNDVESSGELIDEGVDNKNLQMRCSSNPQLLDKNKLVGLGLFVSIGIKFYIFSLNVSNTLHNSIGCGINIEHPATRKIYFNFSLLVCCSNFGAVWDELLSVHSKVRYGEYTR